MTRTPIWRAGALALTCLVVACGPSDAPSGPTDAPSASCNGDAECDDGNPCTDDACTEGTCASTPNTATCDDGNPCTTGDACAAGACVGGANDCACADTGDCAPFDDGDLCNGTLVCDDDQLCSVDPATVVACASDACSTATCAPATGTCSRVETCCADDDDNDGDGAVDCADADCEADAACESGCPALAPVEDAPLPVQAATNQTATTTVDGFTDDYVFNQAGDIKLGARRDWGGAIVFYGMAGSSPGLNTTNSIDGADTGREVQIALYDPDRWYQNCAWDASCDAVPSPTECPQEMTYLGWNPVQGGNRCNKGSGYEDVDLGGGAIEVTTQPLFWNPHWDRMDCNSSSCNNPAVNTRKSDVEVTQRARFVRSNVVELSYDVRNLSSIAHRSAAHEFPTVYTAFGRMGTPDLHRLFDSNQQQVAIDQVTSPGSSFRYRNFASPGGWVAFQNTNLDYGVGLYYESGMANFQAWQSGDPKFNNFRGLFSFPIPANATVRARSYLILGSLATIAAEAQWLSSHLPAFGSLDVPAAEATVSGTVSVQGWALDNKGVSAVHLIIDGGAPIALSYGASRPDVCLVWPGYPRCNTNNVGYGGSFPASAVSSAECGSVLEVRVTDSDGNQRIIARKRVYRAP